MRLPGPLFDRLKNGPGFCWIQRSCCFNNFINNPAWFEIMILSLFGFCVDFVFVTEISEITKVINPMLGFNVQNALSSLTVKWEGRPEACRHCWYHWVHFVVFVYIFLISFFSCLSRIVLMFCQNSKLSGKKGLGRNRSNTSSLLTEYRAEHRHFHHHWKRGLSYSEQETTTSPWAPPTLLSNIESSSTMSSWLKTLKRAGTCGTARINTYCYYSKSHQPHQTEQAANDNNDGVITGM